MALERVGTLVIGGGQAGLAVGYHLQRLDLPFLIVDAGDRIGDTWRRRWDSLRLFTANRHNALPGMPFLGPSNAFPAKDEVADYLRAYAERWELPVRHGVAVTRLSKRGELFLATSDDHEFEAEHVVVSMGSYQLPKIPAFAEDLDPAIVQLHSSGYRRPSQLQEGGVLVVGAGNSGFEIALDAADGHPTWLSGRSHTWLAWHPDSSLGVLIETVTWFVGHRLLTLGTPIGRVVGARLSPRSGGPVRWVKPRDIKAAGVERVARVMGTSHGLPLLENGRVLDVANVIWCTGHRTDFSWIDLPVLEDGRPAHERGIVAGQPGLYFVGLFFQYSITSSLLGGVGRDAEHVVRAIAARL
ncbi:MAG: flavin-containing monooxygenase [Acidimicrobiia bacterium]